MYEVRTRIDSRWLISVGKFHPQHVLVNTGKWAVESNGPKAHAKITTRVHEWTDQMVGWMDGTMDE